jgi:L-Ala-D/L-Glu epimerase
MGTHHREESAVVHSLQWRCYRLPLRAGFTTSQGAMTVRYGAVIEVALLNGQKGIGEVAPLPFQERAVLQRAMEPAPQLAVKLVGKSVEQAFSYLSRSALSNQLHASLRCGVDMALLDALSKHRHRSLASELATTPTTSSTSRPQPTGVLVNAVIAEDNLADSMRMATLASTAGFTCLKLKVGAQRQVERDIELVREVRDSIGPDIEIRLDANGAWSLPEATTILNSCAPYRIQYVEQPLPVSASLLDMRALRQRTPVPLAWDEAVVDLSSARRMLAGEVADVLVIKPQVVGGLHISREIVQEAATHGVECVLTSSIESGIGIAATLQLASALPEIHLACGLGTLPILADDLIHETLPVRSGFISVPQISGLGVTLDEQALTSYQVLDAI